MNHSVPPPSLPPDPDDLYAPPQHLRVGQMASLVWSVMRLSSTNTDFAWCTVCRKWYRYRSDFNASYIKTLFKHCKTQHYVAQDHTLKPIPSSTSLPRRISPSATSQIAQQPQNRSSPQLSTPTHQNPVQPTLIAPYPHHANPVPKPAQSSAPNITAELSQQIMQYRAKKRAQAELARAQAARSQVAALSGLMAASQQQADFAAFHAATQRQLELLSARRGQIAKAASAADVTIGALPSFTPANSTPAPLSSSSVGVAFPDLASTAGMLQQQQNAAHIDEMITGSQAMSMLRDPKPLQQRHLVQMKHLLQSASGLSQPAKSLLAQKYNELASQNGPTLALSMPAAAHAASSVPKSGGTATDGSQAGTLTELKASDVNAMATKIPNSGNGQNLLGNSSQNSVAHNGIASARVPTIEQNISSHSSSQSSVPPPPVRLAADTPTSRSKSVTPGPLRGAIAKKSGSTQVRSMMTSITRCELSPQVTKVAERSQNLIFSGTSLFFADAVFQVPSTEAEAMETMRKGTTDVDKDSNGPSNDLYFVSWSHTQFFAAQMAALGYRFLSSNLKRKARQTHPPPVAEWLRLEKYQSVPRPLPSNRTAAEMDAAPSNSNASDTAMATKTGMLSNAHSGDILAQDTGGTALPLSSAPLGTSAPPPGHTNALAHTGTKVAPITATEASATLDARGQTTPPAGGSPPGTIEAPSRSPRPPAASHASRSKLKEVPIIDLT